jgi:hypothetical protein
MEKKRRTWKALPLGGLVVVVACFLAGCTSTTTTVTPDAPSSPHARTDSPGPQPLVAEQPGMRFNTRWCDAVSLYLRGMKNGPAAHGERKLQELLRSANRFEQLASALDQAGFRTTSWAVLSLSKPIRPFVDAVTPPLAAMPPIALWASMRDNAKHMRNWTETKHSRGPSSVVASIVSSLGGC